MEIEIKWKQNFGGGSYSGMQHSTVIEVPDSEKKVTITIDPNSSCVCNRCKERTYEKYGGYGVGAGQFY